MAQLYKVDSPINREQRNNLNATFTDILNRFSNLRYQISILAGGEDLEVILQRIEDAVTNANNTTADTQQVLNDISDALNQLSTALQNSDNAADNANVAAANAQNEISNMQNYVNQLGNAESYDSNKTYSKNNIVEYNGSSFIALQQTTGNTPPILPTKQNDFWQLLVQRGVDGSGSVASVNGQSPDVNGNVELIPDDIGAAKATDLTNLSQSVSTLSAEITKHLEESFTLRNRLGSNVDLNDVTQSGYYAGSDDGINLPVAPGTYFFLEVVNDGDILQKFTTKLTTATDNWNTTYTRIFSGGTWSSWKKISNTNENVIQKSVIRTISLSGIQTITYDFEDIPKLIMIRAAVNDGSSLISSNGVWNDSGQSCTSIYRNSGNNTASSYESHNAIALASNETNVARGRIRNVTKTSFEIEWILEGTPNGTANLFIDIM